MAPGGRTLLAMGCFDKKGCITLLCFVVAIKRLSMIYSGWIVLVFGLGGARWLSK